MTDAMNPETSAAIAGESGSCIVTGDCREVMATWPYSCIDAIVTDPPYGLSFMGKDWDYGIPGMPFWARFLYVAKPGAHLLAFGGTRTFHRLACAIEDAGWEIRDCIMWVYGTGFPKSLDVSKAIDKAAGAEREKVQPGNPPAYQRRIGNRRPWMDDPEHKIDGPAPATEAAAEWDGWGTALKPAWEPILVCRKPFDGTVAANVLKHGTGAMNIDGCRVPVDPERDDMLREVHRKPRESETWEQGSGFKNENNPRTGVPSSGRFPANLIHDGSHEVLAGFPQTSVSKGTAQFKTHRADATVEPQHGQEIGFGDSGSAARFFYCAKASRSERTAGGKVDNKHPTVKPVALMRYLCRLVTPPGGIVLDPFAGSGSTCIAAIQEGFRYIGIEKDEPSAETARARLAASLVCETPDKETD